MEKPIRIGIIGTGGMAGSHADSYHKISGVEIVSCYDVDAERAAAFAAKHKVGSVAVSAAEVIERSDAISIATSDRFHAEYSIQTLNAGKHLLCEKPLTLTLADAEAVGEAAKAAQDNGVIHMVNFSYRSSAALQEAIALAKTGFFGEIRHVHGSYLQSWLNNDFQSASMSYGALWRLSTPMGSQGVLGDLGCHLLDLTTASTDDVTAIRCELRTWQKKVDGAWSPSINGHPLDANDTAIIEFELSGGGVGVCHTTRWATGCGNRIQLEVHGTEGALRFDIEKDATAIELWQANAKGDKAWVTKTLDPTPNNWERFITSIRTGEQDQPDIFRGVRVQAYLDACERSAASGQWVNV